MTEQLNANQIWVNQVCGMMDKILLPPIHNKNHAFVTSAHQVKTRAEKARELVTTYSNTRLRVQVDEIITFLNFIRSERERVDADFKKTPFIFFRKKRILMNHAISLASQQEAFQIALKVIVNSLPPQPELELKPDGVGVKMPKMEVNKETLNGSH